MICKAGLIELNRFSNASLASKDGFSETFLALKEMKTDIAVCLFVCLRIIM